MSRGRIVPLIGAIVPLALTVPLLLRVYRRPRRHLRTWEDVRRLWS